MYDIYKNVEYIYIQLPKIILLSKPILYREMPLALSRPHTLLLRVLQHKEILCT